MLKNKIRNNNCLYTPHPLLSGYATWWRCKHGSTGLHQGVWVGCLPYAIRHPFKYIKWREK